MPMPQYVDSFKFFCFYSSHACAQRARARSWHARRNRLPRPRVHGRMHRDLYMHQTVYVRLVLRLVCVCGRMHRDLYVHQKKGVVLGVGQERLGPPYFFISLVLGLLNNLLWYVPSSRYIWSSAPIFLFLQEQIKDIIITVYVRLVLRLVCVCGRINRDWHALIPQSVYV